MSQAVSHLQCFTLWKQAFQCVFITLFIFNMVQNSVPNNQRKPAFGCVFLIVSIFTMLNRFFQCMNSKRQHVQCWTSCKQAVFSLFHMCNVFHYESELSDVFSIALVHSPYKQAVLSCFKFTIFYTLKISFSTCFHFNDHI